MSIVNDLIELNDNKSDIQDALVAKGVTSAGKHGFGKFAEDISTISTFTPTQAQLDAMNSGITATDVEQITTNKTNISLKQDIIDNSHKLNADLVDDSTATNKFATAAQLSQIATNTSNIAQKIGASDYATQNTGGTVRAWTTTDGTSTTLHISTEAPSP